MRNLTFSNGYFYHIYNRGVDKRRVFQREGEYIRFIKTIHNLLSRGTAQETITTKADDAFRTKIHIASYCLMPNHYHFLIQQLEENAISEFMHRLNTSYTKYFNINHKRTGRLFEYTFKAVQIDTDEQLIHVSRYIHLNPLLGKLVKNLSSYRWSSYPDFIGQRNGKICRKEEILQFFEKDFEKYKKFVLDHADYAEKLKTAEKLLLD